MWKNLLGAVFSWVLGRFFPPPPSPTAPSAESLLRAAQAEKDRADALQAILAAKIQSDAERDAVRSDLGAHADRLRAPDPFQRAG